MFDYVIFIAYTEYAKVLCFFHTHSYSEMAIS